MGDITVPPPKALDPKKGYSPSKAAFAKYLVRSLVLKEIERIPVTKLPEEIVSHELPQDSAIPQRAPGKGLDELPKDFKVGIIGGGIAGLYTALLLQDRGIKYDILEANPDRIGGRLYTHYFENAPHQYYDIGAMRFPDTPIMKRTFDLFKLTGTELGKYIMTYNGQPMRYNDITEVQPDSKKWADDPFRVSTKNGGPVPEETVKRPDEIMEDAFFPYRRKIKRALNACVKHDAQERDADWEKEEERLLSDLERAWNYLMQHDKFSLRDYLSFVESLDEESIHWLETLTSATNWFDEAFSENVLESLAFEYTSKTDPVDNPDDKKPGKEVDWYYIKNGSYNLTMNTLKLLEAKPELGKIEMGKLVTGMSLTPDPQDPKTAPGTQFKIAVQVRGEPNKRVYDTVFSSTTFAAMQKMDLTGLNLPYKTKAAIRSLRYDASTKVAIQFSQAWWLQKDPLNNTPNKDVISGIRGGLGKTDMPIRVCVYPSYNVDDAQNKPAVLLCSYSWGADSERVASMINPVNTSGSAPPYPIDSTAAPSGAPSARPPPIPPSKEPPTPEQQEALLKDTMLDNLARLHSKTEDAYRQMLKLLNDLYVSHHAYDWSKDPYTCGGAFALYGPSQFRTLYPAAVRPAADSRLHIIGEAASAHHAWVVGALDSAARGVHLMCERFRLFGAQKELCERWGEVGEVDEKTAHLQVALGMMGARK